MVILGSTNASMEYNKEKEGAAIRIKMNAGI
jgi:hypothetical protein